MRDNTPDWLNAAITRTPEWEPPPGFAVHVAAAARAELTAPDPRVRRERLLLGHWWRATVVEAISARIQNTLWVVRQYLSVVSG